MITFIRDTDRNVKIHQLGQANYIHSLPAASATSSKYTCGRYFLVAIVEVELHKRSKLRTHFSSGRNLSSMMNVPSRDLNCCVDHVIEPRPLYLSPAPNWCRTPLSCTAKGAMASVTSTSMKPMFCMHDERIRLDVAGFKILLKSAIASFPFYLDTGLSCPGNECSRVQTATTTAVRTPRANLGEPPGTTLRTTLVICIRLCLRAI